MIPFPTLGLGKPRPRVGKQVAQGYRARKCWIWDLNPGTLIQLPSPPRRPTRPALGVYVRLPTVWL